MEVGKKVYWIRDGKLWADVVQCVEEREVKLKIYGWKYARELSETPADAARFMEQENERYQTELRRRIRGIHNELREVNRMVAAGVQPPTEEDIAAAEKLLADMLDEREKREARELERLQESPASRAMYCSSRPPEWTELANALNNAQGW